MSDVGVRRAKAALSSGCKPHPAIAPAGSNRSSDERSKRSHGGTLRHRQDSRYRPDIFASFIARREDVNPADGL